MKVGDLVSLEPHPNDVTDLRKVGTVLKFDVYRGTEQLQPLLLHEAIIEVLWNTGHIGWILQKRVKVIQ